MTDPKLIERVLKLYALAAGTNFSAEADTARAMAEALIAKHKISLPSVKDRAAFSVVDYAPHFKGAQWEFIIVEAVCYACGCAMFFDKARFEAKDPDDSFCLVGSIADLEACQYLLAILHEQRIRDWLRAKREGSADSFYSFCFSFARGVEANVKKQRTQAEIARTKQAWIWYEENIIRVTKVDMAFQGQGRSDAGRAAGEAASLHRGNLGGGSEVRRLKGGPAAG